MKSTYLFLFGIFWVACVNNTTEQTPSVNSSIQRLEALIHEHKPDTSMLKTALLNAYDLAEKISDTQHDSFVAAASQKMADTLINLKKRTEARVYA